MGVAWASAGGGAHNSGWDNFLGILTVPDNVPIIIMLASVIFLTWLSFREARLNDKLIDEGKKEQIYRRMVE